MPVPASDRERCSECETQECFRRLTGLARQATPAPALRRVALAAARTALRGSGLGSAPGAARGRVQQREGEGELPGQWGERYSMRTIHPETLMEHLGHAAAEAESDARAEACVGAMIPLAARVVPQAAPALLRTAPPLIQGAAAVARALRRSPATRPLVRTLPTIVHRTAADLARQAARDLPVTPRAAVQTLARQTVRVLGSPQQCAQAWQRSRALDRRYHRTADPILRGARGSR